MVVGERVGAFSARLFAPEFVSAKQPSLALFAQARYIAIEHGTNKESAFGQQTERLEISQPDRQLQVPFRGILQKQEHVAILVAPLADLHVARAAGEIHFRSLHQDLPPTDLKVRDPQPRLDRSDRRQRARMGLRQK